MKTNLLLSTLCIAATCSLTACEDHRLSPNAPFPERINFTANRQYPEGIAYSAQLNGFVVTSLTQGKLGVVNTDGLYTDFVTPPELVAGVGVKVADGRILVCNGDMGVSSKSSPQTTLKLAQLLVFNINTRQLERQIDLGGLLPNEKHFPNDIAINPDGTVYVTDSFSPVIYRITSGGQASILVRDDARFSSSSFGLNGIVYHPDGYLIVANTGAGKLYKVALKNNNAISEVGGISNLPGDGLVLVGNTDLYVVTGGGSRVAQVRSTDGFATATVAKTDVSGYDQATTNTYVNGQIYTLNARIGEISAAMGNPALLQSNEYSIQRFR